MSRMFSLDEIANAVQGTLILSNPCINPETVFVSGVSKDTRTIKPDDLYIALEGERFDGHDFCMTAYEAGCRVMLISNKRKLPQECCAVLVKDTMKALGSLARHYRFKIGAKVIAVTGSVGKTSTREMICCGLKDSFRIFSTKSNQNNDIGLPMTILEAPMDTELLVLEMGMRLRGEISYLTNIACPDIAIITNVGYSHIERLKSRHEILLAKTEILEGLVPGGVLAINGDDELLSDYAQRNIPITNLLAAIMTDGECKLSNCAIGVCARNVKMDDNGTTFDIKASVAGNDTLINSVKIKQTGMQHVRNAMFAFLCAAFLKADFNRVRDNVLLYEGLLGRGGIIKTDRYLIIDDAYNAAPESMELAFANMSVIGRNRRKVAAIGGMLELGDYAPSLHEQVGKVAGSYEIDKIFVTGDNSSDFVKGVKSTNLSMDVEVCANSDELEKKLSSYVKDGDCILFKASNAFGFEKMARRFAEGVSND